MTCIPMKLADSSIEDRFREICRILAGGILRIVKRPRLGEPAKHAVPFEPSPTCLEVPRPIALSVTTGG